MDRDDFLINTIWGLIVWNMMAVGIMFWQWIVL